jgi:hypothetical protein
MMVAAWNIGQYRPSGAGYGLKIDPVDRDQHFRAEWKSVILVLDGQTTPISANVAKPSFWGKTCHELTSAEIGRWLMRNGLAPWAEHDPPKLVLEPLSEAGHFHLRGPRKEIA